MGPVDEGMYERRITIEDDRPISYQEMYENERKHREELEKCTYELKEKLARAEEQVYKLKEALKAVL